MSVVDQLLADRPVFHVGGTVRWDSLPETLRFIGENTRPGDHSLETGCGVSTVVFASMKSVHTSISPDGREHELVRYYCDEHGINTDTVSFVEGFSDSFLPAAGLRQSIDIAFIDGAHAFPFPVIDWHYIARALKVNGLLILDDIPIPSISMVYKFMLDEPSWRLEKILDGRTAAFRLVAPLQPEDWTLQPFNDRLSFFFLPAWPRLRAETSYIASKARRRLGRRFPVLRRLRRKTSVD